MEDDDRASQVVTIIENASSSAAIGGIGMDPANEVRYLSSTDRRYDVGVERVRSEDVKIWSVCPSSASHQINKPLLHIF